MLITCDTNIIIDFSKINHLYLLKDIFNNVMIANEVKEELLAGEEAGTGESDIIKAMNEWIKVKEVKNKLELIKPYAGWAHIDVADGSFAVWDPARNYWKLKNNEEGTERPPAYVFSPKEVWDGLQREDGTWLCNGLIRDWAGWQKEKGRAFASLTAVLEVVSPTSEEKLVPGGLTRISLDDVRDMPTLKMPYGQEVAVVHASSGMRRIISLAYFLVWCWEEHLKAKELLGEEPETKTVFLVDEVESHLHPKWQRTVIPALMKVMDQLMTSSEVQLIVVTHSPLIMASVEPFFDGKLDAWFDLDLVNNQVVLTPRQFIRQGDVRGWLTSEAFDLKSGYSIEAEKVLEDATQALSNASFSKDDAKALEQRLREVLSDTDPFWMRWRFVAEKKGWLS